MHGELDNWGIGNESFFERYSLNELGYYKIPLTKRIYNFGLYYFENY